MSRRRVPQQTRSDAAAESLSKGIFRHPFPAMRSYHGMCRVALDSAPARSSKFPSQQSEQVTWHLIWMRSCSHAAFTGHSPAVCAAGPLPMMQTWHSDGATMAAAAAVKCRRKCRSLDGSLAGGMHKRAPACLRNWEGNGLRH